MGVQQVGGVQSGRRLTTVLCTDRRWADLLAPSPARHWLIRKWQPRPSSARSRRLLAAPRGRAAALRVLLVDDHPLWCQTLKAVIERGRFAKVVGEAGTGADAVSAARATSPDVVVMDIDMPSVDGVEATRRLVESTATARVLMLSSSDERSDVSHALRAGASGYVLEELRGKQWEEPVRGALVTGQLTRREREILELMAEGCSSHAVAERLHVSLKTVEAHTGAIFSKLGVDSSPAAHRRVLACRHLPHVVTYDGRSRGRPGAEVVGAAPMRSRSRSVTLHKRNSGGGGT